MSPLLQDYRIGIVIPSTGLNGAQLAAVGERLSAVAKLLPEAGLIRVFVPGFDLHDPEATVARDLRNLLERKAKVRTIYVPAAGRHKAGAAAGIIRALGMDERCDEIWCCPAEGQTGRATARVAQVWRLGQAGERPARYKLIPPWVEAPAPPPQSTQPTKGKKSWRDMVNKSNFHW